MSDAPMSRRERRTFEEQAAERAALQDPTIAFAQGLASGEIAALDADGEALSRRDRRRLERLAHPFEAWTAEEEMIATGQIPMMTPERIAEQERISREKAVRAAEESAVASREFRRLASSEIRQVPAHAEPPFFDEPIAHRPPAQAPEAAAEQPSQEPSQPDWPGAQQQAPEAAHERDSSDKDADGGRPKFAPYQPVMALDATPLVAVEPMHVEPPVVEQSEEADTRRFVAQQVTDALFPAGSSQAMLRQQDPFVQQAVDAHEPSDQALIPTLAQPEAVPEREVSAADEMRRLAAEAMSGIERASRADEAAAAAALAAIAATSTAASQPAESAESAASEWEALVQAQAGAQTHPGAQGPSEARMPQDPATAGALADFSWAANGGQDSSVGAVPTEHAFDSLGGPPPHDGLVASASGQYPVQGQYPASGQYPVQGQPQPQPGLQRPQGPAWDSHPADAAQAGASDPNDFTPLANVPKPDFSGFHQQAPPSGFAPVTGAINTSSFGPGGFNASGNNAPGFNTTDPYATGQMSAVRRPDLPEVGGAKHFKWVHLAVIGALMFVLGVVIYNAAFAQ